MKRLFFGLTVLVLFANNAQAQQDPKKELKNAGRALSTYYLDPANNKAKLKEAVDAIEVAAGSDMTNVLAETWIKKGEIYNEIATQIVTVKQVGLGNVNDLPKVENPALQAAAAFQKALTLAQKSYEKKDVLKGLATAQPNLYNMGIYAYEEKAFGPAYEHFQALLASHETLKANEQKSSLDTPEAYNDQLYITGLAALNANNLPEAGKHFEKLYSMGYDKAAIYEAMYKMKMPADVKDEAGIAAAYKFLEEGRKKYADDVSLLFAEINHFLKLGKLDQLISKLQMAIEKEPDNISLYTTLGNVFDNLYQREYGAGNKAKADEYFAKALGYYEQSLQKDPKYFDAIYSAGALYYNKAAAMTQELNKLADDYTKEGLKKYNEKKKEISAQFDLALPYFQRCETLNANDISTLTALKEIFARRDDLEKSNEFKRRLEVLNSGGTNPEPYFKG
ncbi:MAG: hypothetical protein HUU01_01840 [Saprospiraceae bacterium]|nr:hypothetical protein [Saprospiraceae bacterium]